MELPRDLTERARRRWRTRPTVGRMVREWIIVSLDLDHGRERADPVEEERWRRQAETDGLNGPRL